MDHKFSEVPKADIRRSAFNRDHGYKTTFDSGYLVPFYLDEVLPGDTFNVDATLFARMATQIVPLMDNLYLDTFFFFVPNRLIWKHWENFNGAQTYPGASTDYLIPTQELPSGGFAVGSLGDYLGIPTGVTGLTINALPFRAYKKIWDDWFRDENLQSPLLLTENSIGDGPDGTSNSILMRRGKRHDYFTSCLPWPQKGPGVELPLGDSAPVLWKSTNTTWNNSEAAVGVTNFLTTTSGSFSAGLKPEKYDRSTGIYNNLFSDANAHLEADLTNATAATINSLRQAFQIQRLYERDARGGTRYIEILKSHFGVTSPDARLQRSEYLGGNSTPIQINTVPQTSQTSSASPQANLAAFGQVTGRSGFTKSFVEHGYIIGLLNVRADLNYQQGLNRLWSRRTRFDFYWPALANLGEQAVLNKEIYAQGSSVIDSDGNIVDDQPFGYQERFAEYRYHPSIITGKLRSTYTSGTLDYWHLAQKFDSLPVLNQQFIVDNPPVSRALAVQDEPQFILDSHIRCRCVRPMPVYSVPGLIDHM